MNLLITGANGPTGKDCTQSLATVTPSPAWISRIWTITRKDPVHKFIHEIKPTLSSTARPSPQVDLCETQKDQAWAVNVTGAENLALAAPPAAARLVHISTDYVFDGKKRFPDAYSEPMNPPCPVRRHQA